MLSCKGQGEASREQPIRGLLFLVKSVMLEEEGSQSLGRMMTRAACPLSRDPPPRYVGSGAHERARPHPLHTPDRDAQTTRITASTRFGFEVFHRWEHTFGPN